MQTCDATTQRALSLSPRLSPLHRHAALLQILVSCTKGILIDTLETPQHILSRVLPAETTKNLAYLSGPSFAAEVAAGQPTVVTIASANDQAAGRAQMLLSNSRFRCYRTNDVEGVSCMQKMQWLATACMEHAVAESVTPDYTRVCVHDRVSDQGHA